MVIADKPGAQLAAPPAHQTDTRRSSARSAAAFAALAGGLTPLDGEGAARCLARAWQARFGEPVPAAALELLWAQWALETDRGRRMFGNNFGGIKAAHGGVVLSTSEGAGANTLRVRSRFRTYRTADDGARDHVGLLARRYPQAIAAARQGDAAAFVAELARGGYFTASEGAYRAGIERLAAEHAGRVPGPPLPLEPVAPLVDGVLASLRPRVRRG